MAIVVTGLTTDVEAPWLSVTVSFTWNVPAAANVWLGLATAEVPPSPKSHADDAIVPSESVLVLVNDAVRFDAVEVNAATGGWLAIVVTGCVTDVEAPWLSVTASFTW